MTATKRYSTSIERVFKALPAPGVFKEIHIHFINFLNDDGSIRTSKLDKQIEGKIYRLAREGERSLYGMTEYKFPGDDKPVLLICVPDDLAYGRYGRF